MLQPKTILFANQRTKKLVDTVIALLKSIESISKSFESVSVTLPARSLITILTGSEVVDEPIVNEPV